MARINSSSSSTTSRINSTSRSSSSINSSNTRDLMGNHTNQSQQSQDSPSHQTLPPLQSQNPGYAQFGSLSYAHPGSQSHTPTTPHAPVSSSMGNGSTNAYSHISPASAMGPPGYPNYNMSSSMMYPSSTSTSMPGATSAVGLPNIRPMPPGGVGGPMNGLPSLANAQLGQQPSFLQNEEAPTHVVGSQGRRGILPSAPGRPNAPVTAAGQTTKNMIPQKDADGKYPCPHCNKTYLHAKHLKRHLLRREFLVAFLAKLLIDLTFGRHRRPTLLMPSLQGHILPQRHP